MKLAFCLYKHFPFSGLSRDMLRILSVCVGRGHDVTVYAGSWEGPKPEGAEIVIVKHFGFSNHTRAGAYHRKLYPYLRERKFDALVGFNKIPGMDMYYCGDYCFVGRTIQKYSWLYRLTPRFLFYRSFESGVFEVGSHTKILSLSDREQSIYQEHYTTPDNRFFNIPPTLDVNRRGLLNDLPGRKVIRSKLGISDDSFLVLLVGSGFKTKGLDRAIYSIAALPDDIRNKTHFFVVGKDKEARFKDIAKQQGIPDSIKFLGGRDDVPELMKAADLLLHPAYAETTGTVLLEAITYGLPVLATKVCGYAHHIVKAQAGLVLRSPFDQNELNAKLVTMLTSPERETWIANGLAYGNDDDLYHMPEYVSDILENVQNKAELSRTDLEHEGLFYLEENFAKSFSKEMTFEDLMQLEGEVYREAPGRRTIKFESGGKSYFIKTHTGVGWKEIFKNVSNFKAPVVGAKNEWHGVHKLIDLEIDTMTVAGYGLKGSNPAQQLSFIITEALPTGTSLEDYTQSWKNGYKKTKDDIRFKHKVIQKLASTSRTMHENGANHRDYYLCHFLLDLPDNDLNQMKLYMIDLHRMQLRRKTPIRWTVKDIAGLYFSSMDIGLTKRDLFRFIREYKDTSLREALGDELFWDSVIKRGNSLYKSEQSSKTKLARDVVVKAK